MRPEPSEPFDPTSARSSCVLGTAVGLLATYAGFYLVPRPTAGPRLRTLTDRGRDLFSPEYEIPAYLAGCCASVLLSWALYRLAERATSGDEATRRGLGRVWIALGLLTVAVVPALEYLSWTWAMPWLGLLFGPGRRKVVGGSLMASALTVGLAGVFALRSKRLSTLGHNSPEHEPAGNPGEVVPPSRFDSIARDGLWFLCMTIVLVLALAVPDPAVVAGRVWAFDSLHHWDFFAVGPALQLRHGRALGSEAYTQYGVGLPLLLGGRVPLMPLRYDALIALAWGYSCVYFLALGVMLRMVLASRAWASAAVFVAVYVQVFTGLLGHYPVLWMHPSSTVLRYAFDVWFFLGVWCHLRTGRTLGMAGSGVAVGLALLGSTDTGVYLAAVGVLYVAARTLLPGYRAGTARGAMALAISAALIALPGWSLAARGNLGATFFAGVFRAHRGYSGGFGALPYSDLGLEFMTITYVILFAYLVAVGRVVVAAVSNGPVTPSELFRGCVGAYGLAVSLLFVQRSHPYNVSHVIVPFVILAAGTLQSGLRTLGEGASTRVGAFACLATALALAGNLTLWEYPGLVQGMIRGRPPTGSSLGRGLGVGGLSTSEAKYAADFRGVTGGLARLHREGRRVAILDHAEAVFCLASGVPPADHDCPLWPNLFERSRLNEAVARFEEARFEYVMISKDREVIEREHLRDVQAAFLRVIGRDFEPWQDYGRFRIWKARGAKAPSG